MSQAPSIVDAIWETRPQPRARPLTVALLVAACLYSAIVVATWRSGPPLDGWAILLAGKIHRDLARLEGVTTAPPEPEPEPERPPPPEPVPEDIPPPSEPAPETSPPKLAKAEPSTRRQPARPRTPPAQAGRALTSEGEAPVDLTGIVTGDGALYAGGSTAQGGGAKTPVKDASPTPPSAPPPTPKTKPARSRARAPAPVAGDWDCAWPAAADRLEINEASATVRVTVDRRGRPLKVKVVRDPGHGFGEAAIRCAARARFTPALDDDGARTQATSPPIRVRFTR